MADHDPLCPAGDWAEALTFDDEHNTCVYCDLFVQVRADERARIVQVLRDTRRSRCSPGSESPTPTMADHYITAIYREHELPDYLIACACGALIHLIGGSTRAVGREWDRHYNEPDHG